MKNSKISWTHHTFNPWIGCEKVSPGCAHCYAETLNNRMQWCVWGPNGKRQRTSVSYWRQPLAWNRAAQVQIDNWNRLVKMDMVWGVHKARRPRAFCGSLCDWLDDKVPIEWLADLMKLIHGTPNLDWLSLTKRPQNWAQRMKDVFDYEMDQETRAEPWEQMHANWMGECANMTAVPPPNVWIGTSVENQEMAELRIPQLLSIPAKVRFLSCEPLLGPVDLTRVNFHATKAIENVLKCGLTEKIRNLIGKQECINWVICGGESGPKTRPMDPAWARSLRDQCQSAGVPFFYKQDGGLHHGGDLLDGREWKEFPA